MKGLQWKTAKDKTTRYAKTAFGEYVVESGWMGWVDCGLYAKGGIAWSDGRMTKRADVAMRRCERHYAATVKRLLAEIA